MEVALTDFGAAIVSILVPDVRGSMRDVVLGYGDVSGYAANPAYLGVAVGPSANRIRGAAFELEGQTWQLDANDGENNLHSHHQQGYHKRWWQAEELGESSLRFTLEDAHGNMGFPGNKRISITYTVDGQGGLDIAYEGYSDRNTLINLTNHSYFHLDGHGSGDVSEHFVQLFAKEFTPIGRGCITTGEIRACQGTPMDLRQGAKLGERMDAQDEQIRLGAGFDHNFCVDGYDGSLRIFAKARGGESGICLEAYTDLPGFQLYTGNFLDGIEGKQGRVYGRRGGFCLETQYYPNSIQHPDFLQPVFGPDKPYRSRTYWKFALEG